MCIRDRSVSEQLTHFFEGIDMPVGKKEKKALQARNFYAHGLYCLLYTSEGKRLPVLHGQEGTEGYKIHQDIVKAVQEHYATEQILTVKKPTFGSPEFGKLLKTIWEEAVSYTHLWRLTEPSLMHMHWHLLSRNISLRSFW